MSTLFASEIVFSQSLKYRKIDCKSKKRINNGCKARIKIIYYKLVENSFNNDQRIITRVNSVVCLFTK